MSKRDKKLSEKQQVAKWIDEINTLPSDEETVSKMLFVMDDAMMNRKLSFRKAFRFAYSFCMLDYIINEPDIDY